MRKTCKHRLPNGARCGAAVLGRPYRVELNVNHLYDLWRCGPHVLELEEQLLKMLSDEDRASKPARYKLFCDESGVLATTEEIRTWFLALLKNSPQHLTAEQRRLVRGLRGDHARRLKNELVELWQALRPRVEAPEHWDEVTAAQVREGLRHALIETPMKLTVEERRLVGELSDDEGLPPSALALYGRLQADRDMANEA